MTIFDEIFDDNFWWQFLLTIYEDNLRWQFSDDYFWWQFADDNFWWQFWQFWQIFGKHLRFAENWQIFRKISDFPKKFRFSEKNQIFWKIRFSENFRFSEKIQIFWEKNYFLYLLHDGEVCFVQPVDWNKGHRFHISRCISETVAPSAVNVTYLQDGLHQRLQQGFQTRAAWSRGDCIKVTPDPLALLGKVLNPSGSAHFNQQALWSLSFESCATLSSSQKSTQLPI